MNELMMHVIAPAADGVWRRQGRRYTAEGEVSLFPQDAAGWEKAEESAATLAELTAALMIPGRKVEDEKWAARVQELRTAAIAAMQAAKDHAEDVFFAAGGEIDAACEACHDLYMRKPQ